MESGKLIQTLSSFSRSEIKQFEYFIKSPYFNRNKTVIKFMNELGKLYPLFNQKKTTKYILFPKIFPGKKYNEQVMKNIITKLTALSKEFLEFENYRGNILDRKLNLLAKLNSKKLDNIYNTEIKIFNNMLAKSSLINDKHFHNLYRFEDIKIGFHLERNEQTKVFDKVLKSGEYLILNFIIHLSKIINNLTVNRLSFNVNFKSNLPEEFLKSLDINHIIKYMKDNRIENFNLVELYYYRIMVNLNYSDPEYYFKFKKILLSNYKNISREEVYGLFNALETYCVYMINTGKGEFIKEIYRVFRKEIESGYFKFSEDTPVTFMKFRNTYLTALKLKKFVWAEKFVEQFKKDLIDDDRDNIIAMAKAHINFEKGKFIEVLDQMKNVKTDQYYLKLDVQNLKLMTYFELGYTDTLHSAIDSFRHFLSTNKFIRTDFKSRNLEFISCLKNLTHNIEEEDFENILMQRDRLLTNNYDRRTEWLIDKANEYLNKKMHNKYKKHNTSRKSAKII